MEYKIRTQKFYLVTSVLSALTSGRKYDVITQNCDCLTESNVRTLVFRKKARYQNASRYRTQYGKDPPSDNAIRRWLNQFQEIGSVLHCKGTGRPRNPDSNLESLCIFHAYKFWISDLYSDLVVHLLPVENG
jgi:hypothetical protein